MLKRIQEFVEKYNMIQEGDGIVLGVSGGADSVSLFYVMLELSSVYKTKLVVVHVNHGLRGADADKDEEYVRSICLKYNIPFISVRKKIKEIAKARKMSEEETGRKVRYEAFFEVMEQYHFQKIAVAHNKNDVCETVLLNLFRGTGLKGLIGIEPVRGCIIRPLLCLERSEIENYLIKNGIQYQNDISNQQDKYTRNKIRLNVLPYVEENINERVMAHVVNTAETLADVHDYISVQTEKIFNEIVLRNEEEYSFPLEKFIILHPAIQSVFLRKLLFELSGKQQDIEMCHIRMILDTIMKGTGKKLDLPYYIECINRYGEVVLRKKKPNIMQEIAVKIVVPGITEIPDYGINIECKVEELTGENEIVPENLFKNPKNDYTKAFDYDKIKNAILVRTRKTGDYFQCNGKGNIKKLKEYFINEKVPREKRDRILLLSDGNHIIWIFGFRISEYYKINQKTRRILYVKVNGGQNND